MPKIRDIASASVPWFMIDFTTGQIITSKTIPKTMTDNKQILYAPDPVPGLGFEPLNPNRMGNRKIGFTIDIIDRRGSQGNQLLMNQFELLRNQVSFIRSPQGLTEGLQFSEFPRVVYSGWGTHSFPQNCFVTKCDFTPRTDQTNRLGISTLTQVAMELQVDENNALWRAWRFYVQYSGAILGSSSSVASVTGFGSRPY